jgi:lysophospholipase L1-like esterase
MTTATISETLATPADGSTATLRQTKVRLRLVAASGGVATAYTSGLTAVVADSWVAVEDDGTYSFTGVRPNSGSSGDVITTPTGTVYELVVVYPDRTTLTRYISVPDSAGPHAPADILTADPTDLTSYGYYLDKEDRVHGRALTEPLRGFTAALAGAASTPVDIVVVGDSLSEDWQWVDSGTSESVGLRSWVRLFEVDMAERFNAGAVGVGWLAIRSGLGTNPGWDTVTGSLVTTAGLGRYAVQLDATEYAEHTETCDGVDVYFASIASTCTVHVDGVLTATLTASAVPTVWSSGALSSGSHTIKVTAVGGAAVPYGSYWYLGNRTSGVRVHNGGHSGYGPSDHLATVGTIEHIALVDPDCVIVPIGAASGGTVFSGTVAAYTSTIETLLEAIAAEVPSASIVHVAEHAFTGKEATWPAYAAASRALAVDGGYGFADCYETIGYVGAPDTYGLSLADGVHLTAKGMRIMADTILGAVVGGISRVAASEYALADGTRGDFVRTSTAGSQTITNTSAGAYLLDSAFGAIFIGLSRTGDAARRAILFDSALLFGDGTGLTDAGISRLSAGTLAVTGAFRFTEQSAPSSPSANTLVVYAADNGSGTTVLRTKDSAGTVTTLGAGGGGSYTDEEARDAIGAALVAGEGIDITVSDGSDTITIDAELASATNPGVVELGTDAETQTGTDATRAPSLASAAATFFRKLLPTGTMGEITHADGGIFRFISFLTTPVIGLRRTGDAADRAQLLESAVGFGDGTGALDAGFSRTSSGVVGMYGSSKLRPGTPSNTLDAADKAYVDGYAQPLDSELTAIAGLSSAADRVPYFTGSGTASLATFTAAGRNLIDDADAAAQRTTLGLGTAATTAATDYATAADPLGLGMAVTLDPRTFGGAAGVGTSNTAFYGRAVGARSGVTKIGSYFSASSGNVDVGIYSGTGTGRTAAPASRRINAGSTACPAIGWGEITVSSTTIQAGDWFAWAANNTTAAIYVILSGSPTAVTGFTASQATAFPLPSTATPAAGGRNHLLTGY